LIQLINLFLEGFFLGVFFFSGFVVDVGEEGFDVVYLLFVGLDLLL
jgi:hypothetical protein